MNFEYRVGVDVGNTRTSAGIARAADDGPPTVAPVPLGRATDTVPTSVFVTDGGLLFGDIAERRGLTQPDRLVREFKRRVGDDVPIVAGGRRLAAETIYAAYVAWVVETIADREGALPRTVVITVPVTWGSYRRQLISSALAREGVEGVQILPEPAAAAIEYLSSHSLPPGAAIAVYDLGGGTFDSAVVRSAPDGVEVVGTPVGLDDVGGADFDDAVFDHVVQAAGTDAAAADPAALAALRRECVAAKESLSFDADTAVPVLIGRGTVRITRAEFETMIEPSIGRTLDALERAIEAGDVDPGDVHAILLAGGSSRIPRIAQLVGERFGIRVAVDADPKAVVALGAVRAAAGFTPAAVPAMPTESAAAADDGVVEPVGSEAAPRRSWLRRVPAAAYMSGGALVLAGGIVVTTAAGLGIPDPPPASAGDTMPASLLVAASDRDASVTTADPGEPPPALQPPDRRLYLDPRRLVADTPSSERTEESVSAGPTKRQPAKSASSPGEASTVSEPESPASNPSPPGSTGPTPTPAPSPSTSPAEPSPSPSPTPAPTPDPSPDPAPAPEPTPDPVPDPAPAPEPVPEPTPDPPPDPTPPPTDPGPTDPSPVPTEPPPSDPVPGEPPV